MKRASQLGIAAVLIAGSCGSYPPEGNSAAEIARLPVTTKSVVVRSLPDDNVPALARLRDVEVLFFGWGQMALPSRITDRGLESLATLDLPKLRILDLGYC